MQTKINCKLNYYAYEMTPDLFAIYYSSQRKLITNLNGLCVDI